MSCACPRHHTYAHALFLLTNTFPSSGFSFTSRQIQQGCTLQFAGEGWGVPCNSSGDPHSERLLRGQEGLRVTWSHPRLIPQVNLGWWSSSSALGLRLVPCALEVVLGHLLGTVLGSDLMEEQVPYDLIVNMAGPSRAA